MKLIRAQRMALFATGNHATIVHLPCPILGFVAISNWLPAGHRPHLVASENPTGGASAQSVLAAVISAIHRRSFRNIAVVPKALAVFKSD